MMGEIRFVVRTPEITYTPKLLAKALGARIRKYPNEKWPHREFDYRRDFFFACPDAGRVRHAPRDYLSLQTFWGLSKALQRQEIIRLGLPAPLAFTSRYEAAYLPKGKYVIRPLRHEQGRHFRITEEATDFREGREYVSELFPKTREYRIITIYGEPTILLRKKVENPDPLLPWNHNTNGAFFQTVNDWKGSKLGQLDVFEKIKDNPIVRAAHIVGVDILYAKGKWCVIEFNSSPAIQLEHNVQKVAETIKRKIF